MNLPNGHLLQNGKYQLTHVVGQGGFGITYKGVWFTEVKGPLGTIKTEVPICVKEYFFKDYCYRDANSFAVKVHSETGRALFEKFKEKLIKEAKILSEVHHPHIVNVLEVFEENDTAYIAMEYISGHSLKYMMDKEGVLPEPRVLRYVQQIGEALQFVHEKSILHLDIKPSNILIDQTGKARLIDFGVSKRYDIEQQETSTTMLTLSKGFASIEQYDDEGTLNFSPCPDIYSLGATMYNLLTGKIPTESILRAARPLQNPRELNPAISPQTEAAIIKAMEIVPADRFQTVSEMLAALDFSEVEEEEVRKEVSSPEYFEEDETTILFTTRLPKSKKTEDEETVLNIEKGAPSGPKKKKRKVTLISILIIIFASIGSAVALWVQKQKPVSPVTETLNTLPEEKADSIPVPVITGQEMEEQTGGKESLTAEVVNKPVESQKAEQTKPEVKTEKAPVPAEKVKPKTEPEIKKTEQAAPVQPETSREDLDAKYASLISSGKAKMEAGDITGAKNDFMSAQEIKAPAEVVRLILICEDKEKEKQIADRRALYEEKMPFGKFMIVRKKSSGKYGAIDNNAEERIPCKYIISSYSDKGRAFGREDGLIDIYDTEGVLINQGVQDY